MKKLLTFVLAFVVLSSFIVTAYVVGYVNGSDNSFAFDGTMELSSSLAYIELLEKSGVATLKNILISDLDAKMVKVEDTTESRLFPLGHFRRFAFVRGSGVGSQFWTEKAKQYMKRAKVIQEQNNP